MYNTPQTWFFGIGPIQAETDEAAEKKAYYVLDHLNGRPAPTQDQHGWTCLYNAPDNMMVVAFTTSPAQSQSNIRQLLLA